MIVDLGLPDMPGLDVIARLREWFQRPILVLSARSHESDGVPRSISARTTILTKPFGIGELLARLRVAQRHLAERDGADLRRHASKPATWSSILQRIGCSSTPWTFI